MNIYVATNNNRVGLVLTGEHNKVYLYKSFRTDSSNPMDQIVQAVRRGIHYNKINKVLDTSTDINIYSNQSVNLERLYSDEYISRYDYSFKLKEPETNEEKNRMLLATTEIEMERRRQYIRGGR